MFINLIIVSYIVLFFINNEMNWIMENNTLNSYIKDNFKYFKDDKLEIDEIFKFKDDKTKEKFEMFLNGVIYTLKNKSYNESIKEKSNTQIKAESYINYLNNELKNRKLDKETRNLYKDLLMTLEADLKRFNANLDDSIINKLFKNKNISISYYSLIVP